MLCTFSICFHLLYMCVSFCVWFESNSQEPPKALMRHTGFRMVWCCWTVAVEYQLILVHVDMTLNTMFLLGLCRKCTCKRCTANLSHSACPSLFNTTHIWHGIWHHIDLYELVLRSINEWQISFKWKSSTRQYLLTKRYLSYLWPPRLFPIFDPSLT